MSRQTRSGPHPTFTPSCFWYAFSVCAPHSPFSSTAHLPRSCQSSLPLTVLHNPARLPPHHCPSPSPSSHLPTSPPQSSHRHPHSPATTSTLTRSGPQPGSSNSPLPATSSTLSANNSGSGSGRRGRPGAGARLVRHGAGPLRPPRLPGRRPGWWAVVGGGGRGGGGRCAPSAPRRRRPLIYGPWPRPASPAPPGLRFMYVGWFIVWYNSSLV